MSPTWTSRMMAIVVLAAAIVVIATLDLKQIPWPARVALLVLVFSSLLGAGTAMRGTYSSEDLKTPRMRLLTTVAWGVILVGAAAAIAAGLMR